MDIRQKQLDALGRLHDAVKELDSLGYAVTYGITKTTAKPYTVCVTEHLSHYIDVEAYSEEDAIRKANEIIRKGRLYDELTVDAYVIEVKDFAKEMENE